MATPTEWIEEADEDLGSMRDLLPRGRYKHACFHAQQAAEKALKAIVLDLRGSIPRTHNLLKLLDQVRRRDPAFPDHKGAARILNPYYTWARYPDTRPPGAIMPDHAKTEEAVRLAEAVVADARARIAPPPAPARP